MFHLINKLLHKYYSKKWKTKTVRPLNNEKYRLFQQNGEGLYYINFHGDDDNKISKAISAFSHGLSHSFIVLYTEDASRYFSKTEMMLIEDKYRKYYGTNDNFLNTKIWVLGSADNNGINYLNYSTYQDRKQSIRKVKLVLPLQQFICKWLVRPQIMNAYYDFVGLFLWGIKVESKKDLFCSELVYKCFDTIGIKVAKHNKPSPWDIEQCNKDWLVFSNL